MALATLPSKLSQIKIIKKNPSFFSMDIDKNISEIPFSEHFLKYLKTYLKDDPHYFITLSDTKTCSA